MGTKLFDDLIEEIKENFEDDLLDDIWHYWIKPFEIKYRNILSSMLSMMEISLKKIERKDVVDIIAVIFANPVILRLFRDFLPKITQDVFAMLSWKKSVSAKNFADYFGEIFIDKDSFKKKLEFCFFKMEIVESCAKIDRYKSNLFLTPFIKKAYQSICPMPKEYYIYATEPEGCEFFYENNGKIINDLYLQQNYIKENEFQFLNSGMMYKSSVKKITNDLAIDEFFCCNDLFLNNIRSQMLVSFHINNENLAIDGKDVFELLKNGIREYGNFYKNNLSPIFLHLKKTSSVPIDVKVFDNLLNLIKELPVDKWISFYNIKEYIELREISLNLFSFTDAKKKLYISPPICEDFSFIHVLNIHKEYYDIVIIDVLLKGYCFFLAALGIIDIGYNLPKNSLLTMKNCDYISPYDGLKFVKLSKLGAYILGKVENYDIEENCEQGISIDDNRLIVTLNNSNIYAEAFFNNIGKKITSNRYKIDYNTFLRNCNDINDIEEKIESFKTYVVVGLPKIWQTFFDNLKSRIDPLRLRDDFLIFKINEESKELIYFIQNDELLQDNVIKAEKFHILIEKKNENLVKDRLEKLGFAFFGSDIVAGDEEQKLHNK